MPNRNDIAVYDAILDAEVRISEELAKDLGAQSDENNQEYRAHERRISDLLLNGKSPSHPDVMTAAEMAARAKIKMYGFEAQLRIVLGAQMHSQGVATGPPHTWE